MEKRNSVCFSLLTVSLLILLIGCGGGGTGGAIPDIQNQGQATPTQLPSPGQDTPGPEPSYTPNDYVIQLQQEIDNAGGGWIAANNPMAELSEEEKKARCGCKLEVPVNNLRTSDITGSSLPSSFNRYDYLASVKDQGNAPTCVAFASVACVESLVKIFHNDPRYYIDLSEAHLFHYGGGDCSSGMTLGEALDYSRDTGTPPEAYFEYNPLTVCSGNSLAGWEYYVTRTDDRVYLGNSGAIKNHIYNYGPVLAGMDVYLDFYYYSSGVYRHVSGSYMGGHAICIYGWDDSQNCWLCKNSWGYSWGENGTFRIAYNNCQIEYFSAGMIYEGPPSGPYWRENQRVDDAPGNTSVLCPDIAADQSGNAFVVWQDNRNGNFDVYFSWKPSGGAWQVNERVTDPGATKGWTLPAIAVDLSGNAYAVWQDDRNGNSDIYFSFRPFGGAWQANRKVYGGSEGNACNPDIAVDLSGNAYAVWEDDRNGNKDIYFSFCPAGGEWQPGIRVDDGLTGNACNTSIGVDQSGNAYALWTDTRNGDSDIYFSFRPSGGEWQAGEKVSNIMGDNNTYGSNIAVDQAGNACAIWDNGINDKSDIYFSYRPAGGSWSTSRQVNEYRENTGAFWGNIAIDRSGKLYAVWAEMELLSIPPPDGTHRDIYFSCCSPGGEWQVNERVDDCLEDNTDSSFPGIAVDPSGRAYSVWEDNRNSYATDIYFSVRE